MEQEQIPELLIGFLESRLNEEQTARWFAWINEHPDNKKFFFEIKAIYESGKPLPEMEESWSRLVSKHAVRRQAVAPSPGKIRRIPVWRYAAVIAAAVALTSWYFLYFSPADDMQEAQTFRYASGNGMLADTVELPDGTKIRLGQTSRIYYRSDYGKTVRHVWLEGEALFDVAKADKAFVVKLQGQEITALGTRFNVMAYPSDSVFVTTLIEGKVKLNTGAGVENILYPNQQLVYNKLRSAITVRRQADVSAVTSWAEGNYYFSGETLQNMLHRLGNVYGIKFTIASEKLAGRKFNGAFYSGQKISEILQIIQLSIPMQYAMEEGGTKIVIQEKK
ncbi:MAG: FecR domain-containing protein [Bacteroidales bacterium]|jgi:ferric-dicitrate binding protein FerR (iron transport regulator)|nr:FecR domain-containing protein [Bacteroidales bacterium]